MQQRRFFAARMALCTDSAEALCTLCRVHCCACGSLHLGTLQRHLASSARSITAPHEMGVRTTSFFEILYANIVYVLLSIIFARYSKKVSNNFTFLFERGTLRGNNGVQIDKSIIPQN